MRAREQASTAAALSPTDTRREAVGVRTVGGTAAQRRAPHIPTIYALFWMERGTCRSPGWVRSEEK
eukprot:3389545-Prymnesium_polylepis.1